MKLKIFKDKEIEIDFYYYAEKNVKKFLKQKQQWKTSLK